MRDNHQGFTLLEVIVALVIGVIVLSGARAILNQIADSADRTTAASVASDREANTERLIRALVSRTVAADSIDVFRGDASAVHFTSLCDVPEGWRERCSATIQIVSSDLSISQMSREAEGFPTSVSIRLISSRGDSLLLADNLSFAALRYLEDARNSGVWRSSWVSGMTTPLAIGIVTARDTMLMRIGERR